MLYWILLLVADDGTFRVLEDERRALLEFHCRYSEESTLVRRRRPR